MHVDRPDQATRVATLNWRIHTSVIFVIGIAWLAIVYTHPERSGFRGLNDGLLVFLSGAAALGYTVLTSFAMLLAARKRFGALIVHGMMFVGLVLGLLATMVIG